MTPVRACKRATKIDSAGLAVGGELERERLSQVGRGFPV
jgi:hypothetical protein